MSNNERLTLICIHFYLSIINGNRDRFKDNSDLTKADDFQKELEKIKKKHNIKIAKKNQT